MLSIFSKKTVLLFTLLLIGYLLKKTNLYIRAFMNTKNIYFIFIKLK